MKNSLSLPACLAGLQKYAIGEHAARIMQGWFMLHAQGTLSVPAAVSGGKRRGVATVATPASDEGFLGWLSQTQVFAERTAYNYIAAAERAGLTLEMSEEVALATATAALEKFAAEKGWKFSDLYKPALAAPKKEGSGEALPVGQMWFTFADLVTDLCTEEGRALKELVALPMDQLEALETTTRTALDKIRDAKKAKGGRAK